MSKIRPLVLIASDLSTAAHDAYPYAAALAKAIDGRAVIIHADELGPLVGAGAQALGRWLERTATLQRDGAEAARAAFDACGIHAEVRIEPGNPAEVIANYADENAASYLVMAQHGSRRHHLFGSGGHSVVADSLVPVLVVPNVRPDTVPSYRRAVVAIDLDDLSSVALSEAMALAEQIGAEVVSVVHGADPTYFIPDPGFSANTPPLHLGRMPRHDPRIAAARQALEALREKVGLGDIPMTVRDDAEPPAEILDHARQNQADILIVAGPHQGVINRFLSTNRVDEILEMTDRPVLVLPRPYLVASGADAFEG
ncbi:MAG: nucleotide-binding universal stress UspA family protein [Myxococcota bacterium]|jgi:nucleotide-binding universal stress UspA family protein